MQEITELNVQSSFPSEVQALGSKMHLERRLLGHQQLQRPKALWSHLGYSLTVSIAHEAGKSHLPAADRL